MNSCLQLFFEVTCGETFVSVWIGAGVAVGISKLLRTIDMRVSLRFMCIRTIDAGGNI